MVGVEVHSWRSRTRLREAPTFSPPAMSPGVKGTNNRDSAGPGPSYWEFAWPDFAAETGESASDGDQSISITGKADPGRWGWHLRTSRFPMVNPRVQQTHCVATRPLTNHRGAGHTWASCRQPASQKERSHHLHAVSPWSEHCPSLSPCWLLCEMGQQQNRPHRAVAWVTGCKWGRGVAGQRLPPSLPTPHVLRARTFHWV